MEIKDPILIFSFMMFILLVAPLVFRRIRLPEIVGLIVSGVIVGPHALGILKPEGSIQLFATVGLIYIMFLAGLEINLHEFSRQKRYSIVFGALTFLIPMFIGTLGSRTLFAFTWPCAILLASMFASHTLIPFPITSRLGINKERSVVATVGGTIITDTAAILVLAFIVELVTKDLSAGFWIRQVIFLILLVWFALWMLPRLAFFLFRILSPNDNTEFVLILAMVFFTSYLSRLAGVEPIIGAFFAGLALSRIVSEQSPLMNRLEFVGNTLFIPFFLISVGMLVNLRVLVLGWEVWAIASFMVVCVIFCKYAAAMMFSRIMKFSQDEGRLIFGLSVNQAAATLAAVIVGFRIGIFNEAILNGTIIMILVTCIIGPWFTERYGRRIALVRRRVSDQDSNPDERIMIAVGRDESVQLLTDMAILVRSKDSTEALFPLYVVQDGVNVEQRIAIGEKVLGKAVARIVSVNLPVTPVSRIDVNIAEGVLHALKEWHINTLIMGVSRYESDMETILFNVSDKVRHESRQLIFLCRMDHALSIDKKIFLFIPPLLELQSGFDHAFKVIKNLAAVNKLSLCILGVQQTIKYIEKNFQKQTLAMDISFSVLKEWKEFLQHIDDSKISSSDSLFFMGARKGRLAWQPSLFRSYRDIIRRFTKNNIFLVHPPQEKDVYAAGADSSWEKEKEAVRKDSSLVLPVIDIVQKDLNAGARQLLASYFQKTPAAIHVLMKKLSPLDPIELLPGIALLHTHFSELNDPVILLGHIRDEQGISYNDKKICFFFILLSPEGQTEVHLKALTKVAMMARTLQNEKSVSS